MVDPEITVAREFSDSAPVLSSAEATNENIYGKIASTRVLCFFHLRRRWPRQLVGAWTSTLSPLPPFIFPACIIVDRDIVGRETDLYSSFFSTSISSLVKAMGKSTTPRPTLVAPSASSSTSHLAEALILSM